MIYIILHDEDGKRFEEMYSNAKGNADWIPWENSVFNPGAKILRHETNLYLKGFEFEGNSNSLKIIKELSETVKQKDPDITNIFIQIPEGKITREQLTALSKKYSSSKDEKTSYIRFYNFGNTYILNKTFFDSGYSVFGNNIAHEAINAFKTDDEKRYFYLCDSGRLTDFVRAPGENNLPANYIDISKATLVNFSKKSEGDKTEYVILQKVSGIKATEFAFTDRDKTSKYDDIKYNGATIKSIFENNTSLRKSNGKKDTENYPLITFALDGEVKKPKNPVGFPGDKTGFENLASSSCRQFVMEGTNLFDAIKELIGEQEWVDDNVSTVKDYINSKLEEDHEESFLLKIIGRDREETFYSTLLTHVFANSPEIAEEFLRKIYGQNINIKTLTGVYNEKYNIDVCFTYLDSDKKEHLVVIENKIDASFTNEGKKSFEDFFTNKEDKEYVEEVKAEFEGYKKEAKEKNPKIEANQLTKYYLISQVLAKKSKIENINYVVLAPEYKKDFLYKEKNDYYYGEKYKVISYKELKEAIDTVINDSKREYNKLDDDIKDIIIQFNRSIWPYISDSCSYYQRVMCNRFARATIK